MPPDAVEPEKKAAANPRPLQTTRSPTVKLPAHPPLAPIGRRERAQISKGRKEIDARLDLHGMTQTRAHRALLNFLMLARVRTE